MASDDPPSPPIRVLIVEGHDVARHALADHLNDQADIDVVAAVSTVKAAVDQTARLNPTVAVVDLQLPDGNGIDLCRKIRTLSSGTRCIIHTSVGIDPEIAANVDADVVLKQVIGSELLDTIRRTSNSGR